MFHVTLTIWSCLNVHKHPYVFIIRTFRCTPWEDSNRWLECKNGCSSRDWPGPIRHQHSTKILKLNLSLAKKTWIFPSYFSEYYFSDENLASDIFMRRKMSKDGYIPVSLIASFNRMKQLTQDVKLIIDVCKTSDKLQVKDEVWVSSVICYIKWYLGIWSNKYFGRVFSLPLEVVLADQIAASFVYQSVIIFITLKVRLCSLSWGWLMITLEVLFIDMYGYHGV